MLIDCCYTSHTNRKACLNISHCSADLCNTINTVHPLIAGATKRQAEGLFPSIIATMIVLCLSFCAQEAPPPPQPPASDDVMSLDPDTMDEDSFREGLELMEQLEVWCLGLQCLPP